jgi:hypothetical protein
VFAAAFSGGSARPLKACCSRVDSVLDANAAEIATKPVGQGSGASQWRSGNSRPGWSDVSQTIRSSAVRLADPGVKPQVQTTAKRQPTS